MVKPKRLNLVIGETMSAALSWVDSQKHVLSSNEFRVFSQNGFGAFEHPSNLGCLLVSCLPHLVEEYDYVFMIVHNSLVLEYFWVWELLKGCGYGAESLDWIFEGHSLGEEQKNRFWLLEWQVVYVRVDGTARVIPLTELDSSDSELSLWGNLFAETDRLQKLVARLSV